MKLLEQRKYPQYGMSSKLNLRSLLELQRVLCVIKLIVQL